MKPEPFQTLKITHHPGDVPAEARLVVTDAANRNWGGTWGLDHGYYRGRRFELPPAEDRTSRIFIKRSSVIRLIWRYRLSPKRALKVRRLLRSVERGW